MIPFSDVCKKKKEYNILVLSLHKEDKKEIQSADAYTYSARP